MIGSTSAGDAVRRPRVYLDRVESDYLQPIRAGLDWIGLPSRLRWGDTVFIKPNLTFPVFRKGVMTNPRCLEDVVIALRDYTDRIIVGEADSGGYNRFCIDDVFDAIGLRELQRRYGVRIVNLSSCSYRPVKFDYRGRELTVPMSDLLLDQVDLFATVPVPKVHMNTRMSMAVKNQWGCIPEPNLRLRLHPMFEKVVFEVNSRLRPSIAIVDGKYGLNRSGPMAGDVVELGWVMVADDVYAADVVGCELLRMRPDEVYYLRYAAAHEGTIGSIGDIDLNQDVRDYQRERFHLKRAWTDYPGLMAFRSSRIAYLAYDSPLADFLHRLLYVFRKPFYNYASPEATLAADAFDSRSSP
jgi:uncharacterized protein (DUF362 family)